MKRLLFAFFLLTATCATTFVQRAYAQTPVTHTSFNAKVNQMDAEIAAGNMTAAQATWNQVHAMMMTVLGTTKASIHNATTTADVNKYKTILNNQTLIYNDVWSLKSNLAANRAALHTKLVAFDATIY